ncbi:sugar transferase [Polaribacter sp.]|uniref:sugar transferase n=1 Tax=Polaribacter sp. TaxID=1920175 RepID=UPI003EF74779
MKKNEEYAPICLFTYNRFEETKKTVEALQLNNLAPKSVLYIFSDGWKNEEGKEKINKVRSFLKTITGFKKITIFEPKENKGLAKSIITGVSQVINLYGKVIVLEDDLITSPNFLDFMNQALDFYKENNQVFSISGYSMNLTSLKKTKKDYYIGYRASSWGWAAWSRSWNDIDWEIKDYHEFNKSIFSKIKFNRGGSDLSRMLSNQMKGIIDSWAIRWCYNQFKRNQYTIFPSLSKVVSIGFGEEATHTKNTIRFDTVLDTSNQSIFVFDTVVKADKKLLKEYKSKFSVYSRLKDRLL